MKFIGKKERDTFTDERYLSGGVAPTGIEPVFHAWEACVLAARRKRHEKNAAEFLQRKKDALIGYPSSWKVAPTGIEPVFHAWEACVLAARRKRHLQSQILVSGAEAGGFEPPVRLPARQFSKLVVSATHPNFLLLAFRSNRCPSFCQLRCKGRCFFLNRQIFWQKSFKKIISAAI